MPHLRCDYHVDGKVERIENFWALDLEKRRASVPVWPWCGSRRPEMPSRCFFLVYKARSGSTYLADLLSRHPDILMTPESRLFPLLWKWSKRGRRSVETRADLREVLDVVFRHPKLADWGLARAELERAVDERRPVGVDEIAREAVRRFHAQAAPEATVVGIKKGGWYARNIELLRTWFPEARFCTLVRDGRAIFASSKRARHSLTGRPYETDPSESALDWKKHMKGFDRVRDEDWVLRIHYEHLIREQATALGSVLSFLGVDHDRARIENMLEPHSPDYVKDRYEHLHENVGRPPDPSRIEAWRDELSPGEIKAFERIAGRRLRREGYPPVTRPSLLGSLIGTGLSASVHVRWLRRKLRRLADAAG